MASLADAPALKAGHDSKVFVGNLPFKATKLDLIEIFSAFGAVRGVNVRKDRDTDKSRGFAFVTLDSPDAAKQAIAEVHGRTMDGRVLTKPALARGQAAAAAAVAVDVGAGGSADASDDGSWVTAPPRRRRGKRGGQRGGGSSGDRSRASEGHRTNRPPQKKSWTEWASYPSPYKTASSTPFENACSQDTQAAAAGLSSAQELSKPKPDWLASPVEC